jgi:hypothetical protein
LEVVSHAVQAGGWSEDQRHDYGPRARRRPPSPTLPYVARLKLVLMTLQLIKIVAEEKGLSNEKRPSATMYVEDLAEFARVLLATTEMSFEIGWLRIQLILFYQLAGITGNRS